MAPKRDSLLQLCLKLHTVEDDFDPSDAMGTLILRLQMEDMTIPDLRHTIERADTIDKDNFIAQIGNTWGDYYPKFAGAEEHKPAGKTAWTVEEPEGGFTSSEKEALKFLDKEYACHIPLPLQEKFIGLTDIEARIAFKTRHATGARLVDETFNPDLDQWIGNAATHIGIPKPRLVIVDCDYPDAAAFSPPRIAGTLYISTNMLEILSERQIKAIIGHEMNHFKERYDKDSKAVAPMPLRERLAQMLTFILPDPEKGAPYKVEYRSDALGAELVSSEDMINALMASRGRMSKLRQFSLRLKEILREEGIPLRSLPEVIKTIADYDKVYTDKVTKWDIEGGDSQTHMGNRKKNDTHPPTLWRIDEIYRREDERNAPDSGKGH